MQAAVQSPLAGFAHTDVYELYHNDRLHAVDIGILAYVADMLQKELEDEGYFDDLNSYLASLAQRGYSGLSLPTHGLDKEKKTTATERASVFACLPVALLGVPQLPRRNGFILALQGASCFPLLVFICLQLDQFR